MAGMTFAEVTYLVKSNYLFMKRSILVVLTRSLPRVEMMRIIYSFIGSIAEQLTKVYSPQFRRNRGLVGQTEQ